MGRGSRPRVRWRNDRIKKKKAALKRRATERGQERKSAATPSAS